MNHDRHLGNVLQSPDGALIAIDHGETFPTGINPSLLESDMLAGQIGQPLDSSVVAAVKSVDPAALRQDLLNSGLSASQADGAITRLNEIATQGKITGSGLTKSWAVMARG